MKLIHWLRIGGLAAIVGLIIFAVFGNPTLGIFGTIAAFLLIPLGAMIAWHKRHRGD